LNVVLMKYRSVLLGGGCIITAWPLWIFALAPKR
jgi:hypothetical protein